MSYTVRTLSDLPVVLFEAHADFDRAGETDAVVRDVVALLDEASSPVIHILDWTATELDLEDVTQGASTSARGENPAFHHPNVEEVIFVTQNPMMRTVAKNMQSEVYGNVNTSVFDTLDEALDYIRG